RVALHDELLGILGRNVLIDTPIAREGAEQDDAKRARAPSASRDSAPGRETSGRDARVAEIRQSTLDDAEFEKTASEDVALEESAQGEPAFDAGASGDADEADASLAEREMSQTSSQAAFDRLNAPEQQKLRAAKNELGSVDRLQLGKKYQNQIAEQAL